MMKYGMRFRTIDYFQKQGRDLNRMSGWNPNLGATRLNVERAAQEIAYLVIKASGVPRVDMKRLLTSN